MQHFWGCVCLLDELLLSLQKIETRMRKFQSLLIAGLLCCLSGQAQQLFYLPTSAPVAEDTERVVGEGNDKNIVGVVRPAVEVYLPAEEKRNGCAVILCPGGALRALSWGNDVERMAAFLNERGIAVIGLKYHLNSLPMPKGMKMPPTVDVTRIDYFPQADANPLHFPEGDSIMLLAVEDARTAMRFVRAHAEKWGIDANKVGFLGFSAGGGVAIAATILAENEKERPDFLCTNYGPSLMPVSVPSPAPPLLVMTRADHPNVAAGSLALFLEWKKAGGNAELHVYGDGRGPYVLMEETGETTTESWSRQFVLWLQAKGFIEK